MGNTLAIKDRTGAYRYHRVDEEVYVYVRQLEEYIKHPNKSKLKEVYSDRFK